MSQTFGNTFSVEVVFQFKRKKEKKKSFLRLEAKQKSEAEHLRVQSVHPS